MRYLWLCWALLACQETPQSTYLPATLGPTPQADSPAPERVVATWSGGQLTERDLDRRLGEEIRRRTTEFLVEQHDLRTQTVESMISEALLESEAAKRGLPDVEALIRLEVEAKVQEPTAKEIADFFPVLERQLPGATLDEARPLVIAELVRRAHHKRHAAFLEELRAASKARMLVPYPDLPRVEVPIATHDPVLGPDDASVTIVQFAEYQCYYCKKVHDVLLEIRSRYPNDVRIVWKDFPLGTHGRARAAAFAAHCAGDQGRYWEMSTLLLSNQHAVAESDLAHYAHRLRLDGDAFHRCVDSGRHGAGVQEDLELGRSLGVQATPTFFVNGRIVTGAHTLDFFEGLIEQELRR
jgi:protein-disulfide isomerase